MQVDLLARAHRRPSPSLYRRNYLSVLWPSTTKGARRDIVSGFGEPRPEGWFVPSTPSESSLPPHLLANSRMCPLVRSRFLGPALECFGYFYKPRQSPGIPVHALLL